MRARSVVSRGFLSIVVAIAAGCGGTSSPSWNPPFSGRRAYLVSSAVSVSGGPAAAMPTFTLAFDADQRIGVVGGNRTGSSSPVEAAANGAFRFANPVSVPMWFAGDCPGDSVRYDELQFKVDAAGNLTGTGRGQVSTVSGDVVSTNAATMSLTGVPDTEGPTVGLYTAGMLGDPFTPFTFASSEPLPLDALPVFRAASGDVVMPKSLPGDAFNVTFSPPVLLPFQQSYTVDIANVVDFAGNRPTLDGQLNFGSGAPPLLVAADGFESQADMLVPATSQFLSGPDFPIISGTRSLYVPPENSVGTFEVTQFALRLAIAPGATVLRFSYRTVSLATSVSGPGFEYLVGSVGSPLVTTRLPPDTEAGTPIQIGGQQLILGPLTTATINLPDPAAAEVVFARSTRSASCGRPLPGPAGVMIDDVRTE